MAAMTDYWKANLRLMVGCLIVWFVVSFGFGILLVGPMNQISLGGYKLGFWFAQHDALQDSLQTAYLFMFLIKKMRRKGLHTLKDFLKAGRKWKIIY